jgi:prevent-host-death family protein
MTTLTASKARQQLPEALNQVAYGGERIVIKRRGKVLAVLISEEDLALLEAFEDKADLDEAERRLADPNANFIPYVQARREMGLSRPKSSPKQKVAKRKSSKRAG